ncbi:hypothetical protein G4H71_15255 [Rhodococcus triatomae]|nr:hypothetical protein [Rhodococcus triatomae]QNG19876.1 hypothetical protein G4H72_15115 [Rhodococcus triatomae]QNG24208.1 hypothetical protein G4H71_15255 [Rhodococcus triatomae]
MLDSSPTGTRDELFPALGGDPTPGRAQVAADAAAELMSVADRLRQAHTALSGIGYSDGIWRGEAANAFRSRVGELPAQLDTAGESLRKASNALDGWSSDLASFQRNATTLEAEAAAAKRAVADAERHPGWAEQGRTYTDPHELSAAQARLDAATDSVRRAKNELDAIIEQAKALSRRHQELALAIAAQLRAAADEAPDQGFFERLGDLIGDVIDIHKQMAEMVVEFIKEHADVIEKISDGLSTASTVIAVAGTVVAATGIGGPVAVALLGTSAALSGAALIGHATVAAASDEPIGIDTVKTLASDAVGAIPPLKVLGESVRYTITAGKVTETLGVI